MEALVDNVEVKTAETQKREFDVHNIRKDFSILQREVHGKPLVYLDNAATSQKPQVVLDTLYRYYSSQNSNIHRGVHHLSETATLEYESARQKVQKALNASSEKEIIFVRGTTEAINLVANTYGRTNIKAGDEILISTMEHHSNIVPWQLLCETTGAHLKIIPINDDGEIIFEEYEKLLSERTKLVAVVHISNSLGTINPVQQMIEAAHARNVPVLLDGAQAAPHQRVDVQALDCDFYTLSGHKVFGPTGIGVLYAKEELLEAMPPYQGGGDMIRSVTFEKTTFNELPNKFEAGTPNIAGAIGLGAALDYVEKVGYSAIERHELELLRYATDRLNQLDGLRIIGTARNKASVVSFVLQEVHPHDVGTILDREGIAIRTGHHCTQPLMQRFGVPATSRASFAFYNTKEEVDKLAAALERVIGMFA